MHIRNFVRNDILDTRSYLKTVIDFLSLNEIVATRPNDHTQCTLYTHTSCGPGLSFVHFKIFTFIFKFPGSFSATNAPQVRLTDLRCISK